MKHVSIYSTPSCHYCNLAKDYFREHGVMYIEHNVASDAAKRAEMVELTGQMGVPVIVIDDSIMVGYNEEALEKLLAQEDKPTAKVVPMHQDEDLAQAA